jgi:hypothetical protein
MERKYRIKKVKESVKQVPTGRIVSWDSYIPQVNYWGIWWNLSENWYNLKDFGDGVIMFSERWITRCISRTGWEEEYKAQEIIDLAKKQEYINIY